MSTKRHYGFTMVELMVVISIIAVIAAIAIPNLLRSKMAANEACAIAALKTYTGAQFTFKRHDYDGDNQLEFADDFTMLYATLVQGKPVGYIDQAFASATALPMGTPHAGYVYADMPLKDGVPIDYKSGFGLCATPITFNRTAANMYIVDETGAIYFKNTGNNIPVVDFPADPHGDGWLPVGAQ